LATQALNLHENRTPDIAWASEGAMQFLADQLIDNIEAFVRGAPKNLVT
jgi:glycerate dehydrogenase